MIKGSGFRWLLKIADRKGASEFWHQFYLQELEKATESSRGQEWEEYKFQSLKEKWKAIS